MSIKPQSFSSALSRNAFAKTSLRSFSASARWMGSGETDLSLSQKLAEEIQFEVEAAAEQPGEPEFISDFKANGVWKIEDVPGHDEVVLSRQFGNESIRVTFSIADIDTPQDTYPPFSESADPDAPAESDADAPSETYPVRCSITISKPTKGALTIEAVTQEGALVVDNISYYADGKLATELTADADWKRRGLYIGPQFDHLDATVQEEFERYLEERGIGANIAVFVPDYAEYKEQKEYVKWLENVKSFVDQ
jgi:complement component 1 Q subcomponent-binding protein